MISHKPPTENTVATQLLQILADRLPTTWNVQPRANPRSTQFDLLIDITPPSRDVTTLAVEIKRTIEPRRINDSAQQVRALIEHAGINATPVVASSYLSQRSRDLLEELGVSYMDTTGNILIDAPVASLFIKTDGATKNPWPQHRELSSLRGRRAGRAIRAIIDSTPPFGVRELATDTGTSAATVSRVLELLEVEDLITREPRGPVLAVDWQGAIRRWTDDYDQTTSNTATTFVAPRGTSVLLEKLKTCQLSYAATGAFAAQGFNPIAPAKTATLYVDDVHKAAALLDLRETDGATNVTLLEPFDSVVFERNIDRDGLLCVAPTQLAADLLTGPGREPSQGEAILDWMEENYDAWRT